MWQVNSPAQGDSMNKYILIAFAVMVMAFYELSGGADFEPGNNSLVIFAEPKPVQPDPSSRPEIVARSDTDTGLAGLTDIAPARAVIDPVGLNSTPVVVPVALESEIPVEKRDSAIGASQDVAAVDEIQPDLRFVDGDRVNVRGGPGTGYAVVGKLFRNDMVEILADEGNGWLHLRDTVTGEEGWIADWLVTAAN
jgi:hypothetical protein